MRRVVMGLAVAALTACLGSWAAADDQYLAQSIARNLKTSGQMKGYNIGIKCVQGQAVLSGTVTNEQQRQAALAIAQQTEGVEQVIDNIGLTQRMRLASNRTAAPAAGPQQGYAGPQQGYAGPPVNYAGATGAAAPRGFAPAGSVPVNHASNAAMGAGGVVGAIPAYVQGGGGGAGVVPARYDQPYLPNHAWPAYAAYPNYAGVTYPKQYSATAWPYIGPFYPYPQVPLGWRKVTLEWDDGWWMLDFKARRH